MFRLLTGLPAPVEMVIFTLLISTVEAFRQPAGGSILPMIVDKEQYNEAVSYQSGCSSAAELVGLGAGALIIGTLGNAGAVLIDVITFMISAVLLSCMKTKETKKRDREPFSVRKLFHELGDGVEVVKESDTMQYLVLLGVILNALLVPYNCLEAAMAKEVLHGGEQILSVVGVSLSLGMIAGALLYPKIVKYVSKQKILLGSSLMIGALYLGTVAIGTWIASPAGVLFAEGMLTFLVGIGVALLNTFANASVIQKCDKRYLTRLSGLMGSASAVAVPVASVLVSVVVGFISIAAFFTISGILVITVCLWLFSKKTMPEEFTGKEIRNCSEV